jgi:hypothetical protein
MIEATITGHAKLGRKTADFNIPVPTAVRSAVA